MYSTWVQKGAKADEHSTRPDMILNSNVIFQGINTRLKN